MKKSIKVIHWLPRIICILTILFISIFALDSFAPELTIWQQIGAFIIHLIPSFILLAFLIVAWKWEYIGGIIFLIIGLGFSLINMLIITIPFIIVGVLFIVSHFLKKKNK